MLLLLRVSSVIVAVQADAFLDITAGCSLPQSSFHNNSRNFDLAICLHLDTICIHPSASNFDGNKPEHNSFCSVRKSARSVASCSQ
jgi:hypothetical protein